LQDFNQKIIKGRIGGTAEITDKGVSFAISYNQVDRVMRIPCCIMKSKMGLLKNAAEEYLYEENIGKEIVVIGTDFYYENQLLLMVEKMFLADNVLPKSENKRPYIDFSDN
jgi:hypothetical protein